MPKIVWIASYPKSGNTWVRFLVHNLLFGKPELSRDVDRKIPDIHRTPEFIKEISADGAALQTHLRYSSDMPSARDTAGFVLVVRNPVDVLASNMNFYLLTQLQHFVNAMKIDAKDGTDIKVDQLCSNYVSDFLAHRGDSLALKIGSGTWDEHALSWVSARERFPSIVVRYEDLKDNAVHEVERLCRFLQTDFDSRKIESAVQNSSFEAMKEMQECEIRNKKEGRFYSSKFELAYRSGLRFVNKGKVGWGSQSFGPKVISKLYELYTPALAQLGYALSEDGKQLRARDCPVTDIRPLPPMVF